MDYDRVDGTKISDIGLGTWTVGGGWWSASNDHDTEELRVLIDAFKKGYTHIDTAPGYGAGHAEELIGQAIKEFDREKFFITTKVDRMHLHRNDVLDSARKSLARLKTNYIDLYLIHSWNSQISIEETMSALDELVDNGLVKRIGVSNFTVEQMKQAQMYTKHKIFANQIEYNLAVRNVSEYGKLLMEDEIIPYCQKNNILIIAYQPLARGRLLEKHLLLDELQEKYHRTKSQIAINWLISKKGIVTIPKSTSTEHLQENLGALGWEMSKEDLRRLDKIVFSYSLY